MEKNIGLRRQDLLGDLKGRILDVGAGTGVNFQYFSKETDVIAIEPSKPMMDKALAKLKNKPHIKIYNLGVNDLKVNELIAESSLDYITSTLVLCTIPNPFKALENYKRWLKPSGKLVVLEHIKSTGKVIGGMQEVLNPLWRGFADGCNLNRHTDQYLLDAGFVPDTHFYSGRSLRWIQGVYSLPIVQTS